MSWVSFTDEAAFHTYHDAVCAEHGIPHPGRNAATGAVDVDATWTTAWVTPVDDGGTIKANVPDEDVDAYGLTPTDAPQYPTPEDPDVTPPDPVGFVFHKEPGERLRERLTDAEQD